MDMGAYMCIARKKKIIFKLSNLFNNKNNQNFNDDLQEKNDFKLI